tara:strand:- start:20 stop:637 length:618 start_codon:yes stop_codon:yes gene_type:complete
MVANNTRLSSENLIHKPLTINNFLQINRLDIKKSYNRIITTAESLQMDPVTITAALSVAKSAFTAIKNGFAVGKDIESMGKDLSRWMGALSDVDNAEKTTKNASALQKLFKGKEIEASAIEAFTAKKKLEQQRQELKTFINFHYGANSWNEILHMEGQIRKQRQKEIYERQELIRKIWEWIGIIVLCITIIGFITLLAYLYVNKN